MSNPLMLDPDKHVCFAHGIPQNPTDDDIEDFAQYRLSVYMTEPWSGNLFSMYFGKHIGTFSSDMFGTLLKKTRRRLKDLQRGKGVYVEKRRGLLTRDALFVATQDKLPWPIEQSEGLNQNTLSTSQEQSVEILPRNALHAEIMPVPISNLESNSWAMSLAVMNVFKSYQQTSQKYSGSHDDNFQTAFALFCERCNQATLPQKCRHLAFSTMLTEPALNFFLIHIRENCKTVDDMVTRLNERFVAQETILALSREWESINLVEFHKKHQRFPG